jgi:hypothetical protein
MAPEPPRRPEQWFRRHDRRLPGEDAWYRRPGYPDEVGGADIYVAVLDAGVHDPEGFDAWLTRRSAPVPEV